MPKRMAIDSILGLKEILKNMNRLKSLKKKSCVDLAYALLNLTPGYIEEMISRQYSAITIGRQIV